MPLAALCVASVVLADVVLKNQGTSVGPVISVNCGAGVTCSKSGTTGTITIDAGNRFNLWDESVDAGTVEGLNCTGPGVTCTRSGTQAILYVDAGSIVTRVLTVSTPLTIYDDGGTVNITYAAALNVNVTAVGNVDVSGPDDLISYTLAANTITTAGHGVRIKAWGVTANNANAKTVAIVWGSQTLLTKQLTPSVAGTWEFSVTCARTGTSTQDCYVVGSNNNGSAMASTDGTTIVKQAALVAGTQTETATIVIKGQSTVSTANNDIIQEGMITEYF